MPAQPITIRTFDSQLAASIVAQALAREYGSGINVTTVEEPAREPVVAEGERTPRPIRHNVMANRRDGRRITNDLVQALCAFASGANAVVEHMILPQQGAGPEQHLPPTTYGCEFCRPSEGDPFTNRPQGEAWTCPYCNTPFTGKEHK